VRSSVCVKVKRPTDAEAGAILGITPELDPERFYDVAVVT